MRRANGTGSIHKMSGKRRKKWRLRDTIGFDANGKQLYKELGLYLSRAEAEEAYNFYKNDPGLFNKIPLEYLYNKWHALMMDKSLSASTIKMYENAWKHLEHLKNRDIKEIRTMHIQESMSPEDSKSLNKQIKSLANQLFEYALDNDLVRKNFAARAIIVGLDPEEKELFTQSEKAILWDNLNIPFVDSILILMFTGYRIGELLSLTKDKIKKITIKEEEYWYAQHGNKTEAGKNKIVPFPSIILPLVKRNYNSSQTYLIERNGSGKKIDVDNYRTRIFNPIIEQLKLNPKLTPHSTQHNYATMLNKNVANKTTIINLMGHEDHDMTLHYTHQGLEELIEAVKDLH